jgi:O-antigen/teichoic acid export membrane protein
VNTHEPAGEHRHSFFRQSGWMMLAITTSGVLMFGVHAFAPFMSKSEYGLFSTLLSLILMMMVPVLGLQTLFAQLAASVQNEAGQRQLTGAARVLFRWTFGIWLVMALGVALFQRWLVADLKITNAFALWIALLIGLPQLWLPIVLGLLQGGQNFLWYGWAYILNGLTRLLAVGVAVGLLGCQATGATAGALLGFLVALAVGAWHCRETLTGPVAPVDNQAWLRRVWPLTFGLGVGQIMLVADVPMIQHFVTDPTLTGPYAAAGMMGRGLVLFTAPLTAVMFPKVVRSFARSENTNVLAQALAATAALGALVATCCTIAAKLAPWAIGFLAAAKQPFLARLHTKAEPHVDTILFIATLVPWFVWCMLPLALANVLISTLLATERYQAVPWLVTVMAGYLTTLWFFHGTFVRVIAILGCFNLLLLAVAAAFIWGRRRA